MSIITEKTLHIAMYPWLAMGHITPFLHLANKIAERGHKISLFLPTKTQQKLASHNHHPNLITFIPITIPHVDGLPVGAETTNDVPILLRPNIREAMNLTKDIIDSHLAQLKPDYVFFDFANWIPELAEKHGAKSLYYNTMYMTPNAYLCLQARGILDPDRYKVTESDLLVAPPGFPCPSIRLHRYEARQITSTFSVRTGPAPTMKKCDVIAKKTCREIEGAYCDFLDKHMEHTPILLLGPLLPEPPTCKLDDKFDGWLNGFSHGSVVFCSLGSEANLDKNQFQELVLGLELTGRPFLAALRPPKGSETIESALPEGYIERTKGRGIIHGGWVQQQLILHHPCVGCFITHCGAGSISEGLSSDCKLVLLPQAHDQFLNARLLSMDLRVGVEIDRADEDGFFTKEAICEAVETVMEVENGVGKEVRDNHTYWRNTLLKDGLEDSYIDGFVKSLQDMLE